MNTNQILPIIDTKFIQEKVNEFALKGAIESIKEYYSGYNSPFRKAIDEQLKSKSISTSLDLPDIIGLINESLAKEIDSIANTAIAKTFIPSVHRFLTREAKEMNFSEILKTFIELTDAKSYDDISVSVEKHREYSWYQIELTTEESTYEMTLHEHYESKRDGKVRYSFLSLPRSRTSGEYKYQQQMMKLKVENATLEIPFIPGVLQDNILSFVGRLVISQTVITLDGTEFDDDMFPEGCRCH